MRHVLWLVSVSLGGAIAACSSSEESTSSSSASVPTGDAGAISADMGDAGPTPSAAAPGAMPEPADDVEPTDEPGEPDIGVDPEPTDAPEPGPAGPGVEPADNPADCPAFVPEDGASCASDGGPNFGLECAYGEATCSCFGFGADGPSWNCETTPECPSAPEDGESCDGFQGMTCGDCECDGFGFGADWDCGGNDGPPMFDADGGMPDFGPPDLGESDAGAALPVDGDNPRQCPDTSPPEGAPCMGGGMMGGGAFGLECSYGDEALLCRCGGGGGGMPGVGARWTCEEPEESMECPDDPRDGDACEGFQGETCGECECRGFGDPEWDCSGSPMTPGDAGGFFGGGF